MTRIKLITQLINENRDRSGNWCGGNLRISEILQDSFSWIYVDGLVQERRNSSALAMELRLSCINIDVR